MTRYKKYLAAVAICIVTALFLAPSASAIGSDLVDGTINDAYGFSRYPIGHYALDLYIPQSGGFLGIRLPDVSRILFAITNAIWELSIFLASAVGSVVQEGFRLDFLSRATEEVGRNMQQIAGVSEQGFSSTGFLPMLLPLAVLALGAYVIYVGLFKREITKALDAVVSFLVIFVLIIGFIAFAPTYIQAINTLSVELADGALRVTNAILNPGASDSYVAVAGIRESLHQVQIHTPWQLLQFGSLDIDPARVHDLLRHAPHSEARLDVVLHEIEVYGNLHLAGEVDRFGTVLVLFFVNLGISIFVLSLTGLMIFSQLLLIFYLTLLPIALVLSLFPTFSGIAKRSIERVFNTLLLRVGYTLIISVAFSLSLLVYRVSADLSMPFLLVGFLQILVFWGVHKKQDELLGMLSFRSNESRGMERSVVRTGRRALTFGKGLLIGNMIHRRRVQQRENVPADNNAGGASGTAQHGTDTHAGIDSAPQSNVSAQGRAQNPAQNVDVPIRNPGTPQARNTQARAPSEPEQPRPQVERRTFGGRIGHTIGKLVDTPGKVKDQAGFTMEKVKDVPVHIRDAAHRNVEEFRENLSGTPKARREEHADQREQYRDNVEMKRSIRAQEPTLNTPRTNVETASPMGQRSKRSEPRAHEVPRANVDATPPPREQTTRRDELRTHDTAPTEQAARRGEPRTHEVPHTNVETSLPREQTTRRDQPKANTGVRSQAQAERMASDGSTPRPNVPGEPTAKPDMPRAETYRLNGKPITRDQLVNVGEPSKKRKDRRRDRSKRDAP